MKYIMTWIIFRSFPLYSVLAESSKQVTWQ